MNSFAPWYGSADDKSWSIHVQLSWPVFRDHEDWWKYRRTYFGIWRGAKRQKQTVVKIIAASANDQQNLEHENLPTESHGTYNKEEIAEKGKYPVSNLVTI